MLRLPRKRSLSLLLAAAAFTLPFGAGAAQDPVHVPRPKLGLFSTLPLYWPEARGLSALIGPDAAPHWARGELERAYDLVPLDAIDDPRLAEFDDLLLAQPRALSPAENVALDAWVRGGGRLLLFADPMLTGETIFAAGDKRRPQDVALLSPILAHWNLELRFDPEQPQGEDEAALGDAALPVNLAGRLVALPGGAGGCMLLAEGLAAECAIGEGRALIVADAALFDGANATSGRRAALDWLLRRAFDTRP